MALNNKKTICVWAIGGRRRCKQMGGLFPIGALAGQVLGGIASNLAGALLKKIIAGGKIKIQQRRRRQYLCLFSETISCWIDAQFLKK